MQLIIGQGTHISYVVPIQLLGTYVCFLHCGEM